MGSWWYLSLSAAGEHSKILSLKQALPSLFCVDEIAHRGSFLFARIARNYGGPEALDAIIERHPDLIFIADLVHGMAHPKDPYWVVVGVG